MTHLFCLPHPWCTEGRPEGGLSEGLIVEIHPQKTWGTSAHPISEWSCRTNPEHSLSISSHILQTCRLWHMVGPCILFLCLSDWLLLSFSLLSSHSSPFLWTPCFTPPLFGMGWGDPAELCGLGGCGRCHSSMVLEQYHLIVIFTGPPCSLCRCRFWSWLCEGLSISVSDVLPWNADASGTQSTSWNSWVQPYASLSILSDKFLRRGIYSYWGTFRGR